MEVLEAQEAQVAQVAQAGAARPPRLTVKVMVVMAAWEGEVVSVGVVEGAAGGPQCSFKGWAERVSRREIKFRPLWGDRDQAALRVVLPELKVSGSWVIR